MTEPQKRTKRSRVIIKLIPALIYAIIISFASSVHGTNLPNLGFEVHDKLIHATEYFLLGLLIVWGLHFEWPLPISDRRAILAAAIAIAYGAIDEIHQSFVPGRSSEIQDWLADVFGVILAVVAYRKLNRIGRSIRCFNTFD